MADAGVSPPCTPPELPTELSTICLYDDIQQRQVRSDVIEFEPAYPLWTDGAQKRRWIRLPPSAQVDTTQMDSWHFPVGTQLFKEFSLGGKLLETRMIQRTGAGSSDFLMVTFVWDAAQSEATRVDVGVTNVLGTDHDVPTRMACAECHSGEPGRILGFSAIQLSKPAPPNLTWAAELGLLSAPPPIGASYPVPGTPTEAAALGYLHANCGHCHNPVGPSWKDVKMVLRLSVLERSAAETQLVTTTVNVNTSHWSSQRSKRVAPGSPTQSELHYRMGLRQSNRQMPKIGTEKVDPAGLQAVAEWIQGL